MRQPLLASTRLASLWWKMVPCLRLRPQRAVPTQSTLQHPRQPHLTQYAWKSSALATVAMATAAAHARHTAPTSARVVTLDSTWKATRASRTCVTARMALQRSALPAFLTTLRCVLLATMAFICHRRTHACVARLAPTASVAQAPGTMHQSTGL